MKVYFVEYNHYEDREFYSGWLSKKDAEIALDAVVNKRRAEVAEVGHCFWDENCYAVAEYEVHE